MYFTSPFAFKELCGSFEIQNEILIYIRKGPNLHLFSMDC